MGIMANLSFRLGNVLDAKTDAILLTVDGELIVSSPKGNDRRYGNTANAFSRKWPGVLENEKWYPLRYGDVYAIESDEEYGCSFQFVMLASVLPHPHNDQIIQSASLKTAVRSALKCMVQKVSEYDLKSCAMGLIKCGWRMSAQDALLITVEALDIPDIRESGIAVEVYVNDEKEYEMLSAIAGSIGITSNCSQG
jgi:hypothetical protein